MKMGKINFALVIASLWLVSCSTGSRQESIEPRYNVEVEENEIPCEVLGTWYAEDNKSKFEFHNNRIFYFYCISPITKQVLEDRGRWSKDKNEIYLVFDDHDMGTSTLDVINSNTMSDVSNKHYVKK